MHKITILHLWKNTWFHASRGLERKFIGTINATASNSRLTLVDKGDMVNSGLKGLMNVFKSKLSTCSIGNVTWINLTMLNVRLLQNVKDNSLGKCKCELTLYLLATHAHTKIFRIYKSHTFTRDLISHTNSNPSSTNLSLSYFFRYQLNSALATS